MRHGSTPQPIPPDLVKLLGEPERTIGGQFCWSLATVAKAIGCRTSAVQNWVSKGCLPEAAYDTGRWWIPLVSIEHLVANGVRLPDTFPRLKARNFTRGYPVSNRTVRLLRTGAPPRN